jgi:hypothetical protein
VFRRIRSETWRRKPIHHTTAASFFFPHLHLPRSAGATSPDCPCSVRTHSPARLHGCCSRGWRWRRSTSSLSPSQCACGRRRRRVWGRSSSPGSWSAGSLPRRAEGERPRGLGRARASGGRWRPGRRNSWCGARAESRLCGRSSCSAAVRMHPTSCTRSVSMSTTVSYHETFIA